MQQQRRAARLRGLALFAGLLAAGLASAAAWAAEEHPLLPLLDSELKLSLEKLTGPDGSRPYFIQYAVADVHDLTIAATLGSVTQDQVDHRRLLDVEVRCGDYALDNTRQIRGSPFSGLDFSGRGGTRLPLNDDPVATRQAVWLATDAQFKAAVRRLAQVKANLKVKVEEEDPSDDFSRETPAVHIAPWVEQPVDRAALIALVKRLSERFRREPLLYSSHVTITGSVTNRLAVTSEGHRLQFGQGQWRIAVGAGTLADDGMELWQYKSFDAGSPERLPDEAAVARGVEQVIAEVLALRSAPIVEPYTGPAILMNRAAGVFFHEIFGHRIEGHRQKDVEEGQTFAKKIGQQVLPTFINVVDDPTQRTFRGQDLSGFYPFDDECVPARPARVVEAGVLKTFLLSRSPTRGFTQSNGHGRREPGNKPVARMGNTIIESTKQVPLEQLRTMLLAECRKQGKEFGLLFTDISGGFTMTQRWLPQAFKVVPILVYRVYVDGRPDELVRGVDLVGTPLTCFSKILATGDDPDVFNGTCGAESGGVPVSAICPSILVEQIEVEKKQKAQNRPPILEAPIGQEEK